MQEKRHKPRWQIILTAWPWQGALFVAASFAFTVWWLWDGFSGGEPSGWLEPLASILGGVGAFVLAAILIFRRVDSARSEAESYSLARGLAAGYYFNFIRPLVLAIRDRDHAIHAEVARFGNFRIVALVVGIPSSLAEFDPEQHDEILNSLPGSAGQKFELQEIKVTVARRPRPVFARLALNRRTGCAVIVDIPTTLSVVVDFAEFFATHGADASEDEFVSAARKETVAGVETAEFAARLRQTLEEFQDVVSKVGSMESPGTAAASLVHIVPLRRLQSRLNEVSSG
ncbi:MAG TPA: hypothetical protein DCY13_14905 [Verrucomicrobiales bacterium]|nr:hypothetical protein [Verrucomicrobiales bacterium]